MNFDIKKKKLFYTEYGENDVKIITYASDVM